MKRNNDFPGLKPLETMTCAELVDLIRYTYAISDAHRAARPDLAETLRTEMRSKLSAPPFEFVHFHL